ncbi:hypothetical protein TNCV_4088201 [Trichonephila clavipes]|nr:hypothetical protein TNCV_4088201 [Trichonephila clavipes]
MRQRSRREKLRNQRQARKLFMYQLPAARTTFTRHVIQHVPNSLSQRMVPPLLTQRKRKISPVTVLEGTSFANIVSGETPNLTIVNNKKEKDTTHGILSQENNAFNFVQVLELFF